MAAMRQIICVFFGIFALQVSTLAAAEGFSESWYMLRGRANMKIGNQKAATQAFEKVVEINPANREAMRTLGLAYAAEGLTDKAIQQFDAYLARFPDDADIAFKQADYLAWSRYAYRRADAIKYLKLGLAQREETPARHRLARLLAQDHASLEESLSTYRQILTKTPNDDNVRTEYRKLLLWDSKYVKEATEEYASFVKIHPDDFEASAQLARLLAPAAARREEALTLYGHLVQKHPQDQKLRLEYARLLCKDSEHQSAAVAQYDAFLSRRSDAAVETERADLLAKNPGSRVQALSAYDKILSRSPHNLAVRLAYARLLLAKREDAPTAAQQYEIVLADQPKNSEAQSGAAKAYAWLGQNDRALDHAEKAARLQRDASANAAHSASADETQQLRSELHRGRETRVGGRVELLAQPGADYAVGGALVAAVARADASPYVSLAATLGYESYRHATEVAEGSIAEVSAEARISESARINARIGLHSLGLVSRKDTYELKFQARTGDWQISPGVRREIRYDSLVAIAGAQVNDSEIGAARAQTFSLDLETEHADLSYGLTPWLGSIESLSSATNNYYGTDGHIALNFWRSAAWSLAAGYEINMAHYSDDRSGLGPSDVQPYGGGYYSPQLLAYQTPELLLRYKDRLALSWTLTGGPSLEYTQTVEGGRQLVVSAKADSYLSGRIGDATDIEMVVSYQRSPLTGVRVQAVVQALTSF